MRDRDIIHVRDRGRIFFLKRADERCIKFEKNIYIQKFQILCEIFFSVISVNYLTPYVYGIPGMEGYANSGLLYGVGK